MPNNPTYEFGFEVTTRFTLSPGATSSDVILISTFLIKIRILIF